MVQNSDLKGHYRAYEQHKAEIARLNARATHEDEHYSINFFADLTDEERMEWVLPLEDEDGRRRLGVEDCITGSHDSLPTDSSRRSDTSMALGACGSVKDQGDLGTCWAFASTGQLQCNYNDEMADNKVFSEKYATDCSGDDIGGVNGGLMHKLTAWYDDNGACTNYHKGYDGSDMTDYNGDCGCQVTKTYGQCHALYAQNDGAVIAAAATEHAWDFAVGICGSFRFADDTWYGCHDDEELKGGHAMVIVGQQKGEKVLVRNSWGSGWGLSGQYGGHIWFHKDVWSSKAGNWFKSLPLTRTAFESCGDADGVNPVTLGAVHCGDEHEDEYCHGPGTVFYGHGDQWVTKELASGESVHCSNSAIGCDPIYGVQKDCYLAFGSCVPSATTSGFASSNYNGKWEEYEDCNGKTAYKHTDRNLYLFRNKWNSATWIAGTFCGGTVDYYYWWGGTNNWKNVGGSSVTGSVHYHKCDQDYQHLGCYKDSASRALDYGPREGDISSRAADMTIEACHEWSVQNGYTYFAVQHGGGSNKGECRCSNSLSEATQYGSATNCEAGTGGGMANDLYLNKVSTSSAEARFVRIEGDAPGTDSWEYPIGPDNLEYADSEPAAWTLVLNSKDLAILVLVAINLVMLVAVYFVCWGSRGRGGRPKYQKVVMADSEAEAMVRDEEDLSV